MNTSDSDNYGLVDNLASFAKEPRMQVLSECEDVATISGENTESTMAGAPDSNMFLVITPSMMQKIASLPQIRKEKVLGVWNQIVQGTYDLDERLDVVIDHLLADIKT